MKEDGHSQRFDVGDAHTVDTGRPTVGTYVVPRSGQHVAAGDVAIQGVETAGGFLLGAAVQHTLQGSGLVQAVGLPDGPRRVIPGGIRR